MATRAANVAHGFMLRLPEGMRERIKSAAKLNNRSMNAEIVAALAEHYPDPADPFDAVVEGVLDLLASPSGQEQQASDPAAAWQDLTALFDRLRQEVERRRE